jgi:hypothetical protein
MASKQGKKAGTVSRAGVTVAVNKSSREVGTEPVRELPFLVVYVCRWAHCHTAINGMECGHDRCRHWWASQGRYLWYDSARCHLPVACVFSSTSAIHLPLSWFPSNFIPRQPATVYLKKINPDKRKITAEHVRRSLAHAGRYLSDDEVMTKITEFHDEAISVIAWGANQVVKRMLNVAAKLHLELDGHQVVTFADLKTGWERDGGKLNTGKYYMICHGDYEGKRNQHWSRTLEMDYMREQKIEYDRQPELRGKGGYEQCITQAKVNVVRQIMNKSLKTHEGRITLSLKNKKDRTEAGTDKKRRTPGGKKENFSS